MCFFLTITYQICSDLIILSLFKSCSIFAWGVLLLTADPTEKDGTDYEEVTDYSEYHYVVVIPEDVYEQLETDEQEKFSGCDLTNWMDEEFVVEEHGVEADELNELW